MRPRLSVAFGIPRSTSYYHHTLPDKDDALRVRIEAVMKDNPAYGHERVAMALDDGTERVRRVMHKFDLRPAIRRIKPWQEPKVADGAVLTTCKTSSAKGRQRGPSTSGPVTSPTSGSTVRGTTWLRCWIYSPEKLLAGNWANGAKPSYPPGVL